MDKASLKYFTVTCCTLTSIYLKHHGCLSIFSSGSSLDLGDIVRIEEEEGEEEEEEEGGERSKEVEVEDEDEDERRVDVESGERAEREVRRNGGEERQMREQRDEGERAHSYSSKRRKQEKSKQGNPPRNPSTEDLYEILKTPIQPDDPDETFLLSLLPEFKQVTTNKGQLKAQLLTTILNWDNNQVFTLPPNHTTPSHPTTALTISTTQSTPLMNMNE